MDSAERNRMRRVCKAHFRRRVRERLGARADPDEIMQRVTDAILAGGTEHVSFITRLHRGGRRLWRVETGGDPFFVIFDHALDCPVTVLLPEGRLTQQRRGRRSQYVNLEKLR